MPLIAVTNERWMASRSLLIRPIDTARLRIRQFRADDSEPFIRFMTDEGSTRFLPFDQAQRSPEGAEKLLETTMASYDSEEPMLAMAVEERATGAFVGFCGLSPRDEETMEVLYAVMPEARRKGYATEIASALAEYALNRLGFLRVAAFIVPANEPSKVVAARAGFVDGGLVKNRNYKRLVHRFILDRETAPG